MFFFVEEKGVTVNDVDKKPAKQEDEESDSEEDSDTGSDDESEEEDDGPAQSDAAKKREKALQRIHVTFKICCVLSFDEVSFVTGEANCSRKGQNNRQSSSGNCVRFRACGHRKNEDFG